jgi:iron complex transport system substrate-binding protein
MRAQIASIVASVPTPSAPLTYYHELDDTYYSVTSKTFIGRLYSLLGLRDIADAAAKTGPGYPQLSPEYIVRADPDLIFLADTKCCGQTPQTVAKRPAFASIPAVKDGKIIAADDDIVSRWGPRTADFAELVAKELSGK